MIRIKTTLYNYSPFSEYSLNKQTPGQSGMWGAYKFFPNDDIKESDYWVVFEGLDKAEEVVCPQENTIFIAAEGSAIRNYNGRFLEQFAYVITCQRGLQHRSISYLAPGHVWFPLKTYDELTHMDHVEKSKLLSIVVSNKSGREGHRKRLEFCLRLKDRFGDAIDLYGRGIRDFKDKWNVLAPYKYSIAIENSVETDWLTEKLGDCFTAHTFPFYFGCPNATDYYDPRSFMRIDIDDFEGSAALIERTISTEQHYERSLPYLIESKRRYLNQYSMVPLIAHFIDGLPQRELQTPELVRIRPENSYMTWENRAALVRHEAGKMLKRLGLRRK